MGTKHRNQVGVKSNEQKPCSFQTQRGEDCPDKQFNNRERNGLPVCWVHSKAVRPLKRRKGIL